MPTANDHKVGRRDHTSNANLVSDIYIGTVFAANGNLASAAANLARRSLTIHPNRMPAATIGSIRLLALSLPFSPGH